MGGRLFKNRVLRLPLGNLAECFYDLWCAIAEVAQMALKPWLSLSSLSGHFRPDYKVF